MGEQLHGPLWIRLQKPKELILCLFASLADRPRGHLQDRFWSQLWDQTGWTWGQLSDQLKEDWNNDG